MTFEMLLCRQEVGRRRKITFCSAVEINGTEGKGVYLQLKQKMEFPLVHGILKKNRRFVSLVLHLNPLGAQLFIVIIPMHITGIKLQ